MISKILRFLVVFVLFVGILYVALCLLFPTDSVRHYAEKSLEKALKQEQTVEIKSIRISPLLNVTVKDFSMTPRTLDDEQHFETKGGEFDGYSCAPYIESMPFTIKEAFVSPKILKTVRNTPEGTFKLKFDAGSVEGDFKTRSKVMEVNAKGKDISLNEFALLSNLTKMQIYGALEFTLRTIIEKGKLAELNVDMTASNIAVCPKRLQLKSPSLPYIDLPFVVLGDVTAEFELKKDHLTIISLKSTGPDLQIDAKGDVWLKSAERTVPTLEIEADILPSEEWVKANNMKVLYQVCEKHDDGSIYLKLSGTTKKIKHDCGTPIPEPVEVVEAPKKPEPAKVETKDDKDKKDEPKKDDKKADEPPPPPPHDDARPDEPPPRKRGERRGPPPPPPGQSRPGGVAARQHAFEDSVAEEMRQIDSPRERRQRQSEVDMERQIMRDMEARGNHDFSNHAMGDFRDVEPPPDRIGVRSDDEFREKLGSGDGSHRPRRGGGRRHGGNIERVPRN